MKGPGGSLALQLEHDQALIMTGSEEIVRGMSSQNPETVGVATNCGHTRTLGQIPNTDGLILRIGNQKILLRMEYGTAYVVRVASKGVQQPSFIF